MRLQFLLSAHLLVGFACTGAGASIDFTPKYELSIQDGTPMNRLTLSSPGKKIRFRPRPSWRVSGNSSSLTLVPESPTEASAVIENAPAGLPPAFDEAGLPIYRKAAQALLPSAAEKVEAPDEQQGPVAINDWRSWEYSCQYVLAGRKFVRSILFVKLDDRREIRVIVDTRATDFEKFRSAVHASLATWFEEEA